MSTSLETPLLAWCLGAFLNFPLEHCGTAGTTGCLGGTMLWKSPAAPHSVCQGDRRWENRRETLFLNVGKVGQVSQALLPLLPAFLQFTPS